VAEPVTYVGWVKRKNRPWEQIPGLTAVSQAAGYTLLMERHVLTAGTTGEDRYALLPEGQHPHAELQKYPRRGYGW
jgi:hypothetical protein